MRRPTSTLNPNRRRFVAAAVALVLAVTGLTVLAIFVAASMAPSSAPSVSRTPAPTQAAPPTPQPTAPGAFPTRESAGLPDAWKPVREVTGDYWIREAGAVIEDVRFTDGTIYVDAPNVTLRRIQAVGASVVNDYNNVCKNGLLIEDSEFTANGRTSDADLEVIGPGGYTVRNTVIDAVPEGLRVGGGIHGCSAVQVERSFIRIVSA